MDMTTKFTFLYIKLISMYIFGSILPDSFGYSMFEKKLNKCLNKTESRRYNLRFHFSVYFAASFKFMGLFTYRINSIIKVTAHNVITLNALLCSQKQICMFDLGCPNFKTFNSL